MEDTGSLMFLLNVLVALVGGLLSFLLYKIFGTLTELNEDMKSYSSRLTVLETRCELNHCQQRTNHPSQGG